MDLLEAYKEAEQGFLAAWKDAQEFFDANRCDRHVLATAEKHGYDVLIERVEHYKQQLARLEDLLTLDHRMRALSQ